MRYAVRGDVAEKSTGRCQPARSAPTEGELFSPVKKSMISQRDQVVQRNASREVSITGNLQGITGNIREFSRKLFDPSNINALAPKSAPGTGNNREFDGAFPTRPKEMRPATIAGAH